MVCAECGRRLTGRQRRWCSVHRPNPFDPASAPYGRYQGATQDPYDWAQAFKERFSKIEIEEYLGSRDPWDVLGIKPGSPLDAIKAAYRKRARATHPDLNPGKDRAEFQAVLAAYETLSIGLT